MRYHAKGPVLTIPNGGRDSNEIDIPPHIVAAKIACQESTITGTLVVQTSDDGGTSWQTLQSGGSDVTIGADQAVIIAPLIGEVLRIQSDLDEGADRDFQVYWVDES